jgi:IS1 family transposase
VKSRTAAVTGDQYTYIALAASARAIVSYRTGKRDTANTDLFIQDLRERVIGSPEISSDGFLPYQPAIRDAFANSAYGQITKTYAVTDLRKSAAHRYSPAEVVAVSRDVVAGVPAQIPQQSLARVPRP